MMMFKTVKEPEATRAREGFKQFRRNEEVLLREWPRLLAQHKNEWAAVYDDGKLIVKPNLETMSEALPRKELDTAIVRFIDESDDALIL